jgi:hypothetical protein
MFYHPQNTLFSASALQLLSIIKADGSGVFDVSSSAKTLVLVSSYSAILFNAFAAIVAFAFTDSLGSIEYNEACKGRDTRAGFVPHTSSLQFLRTFGAGKNFMLIFLQCAVHSSFYHTPVTILKG